MKKHLFLAAGFLCLSFFVSAPLASAKDLGRLEVKLSDNINKDCDQPDGYDPVWACVSQDRPAGASAPIGTIRIRKDIPSQLLPYVLFRNIGLYLTWDLSEQALKDVFRPAPGLAGEDIRDIAGNTFAYWAMGGRIGYDQEQLFRRLLAN